MAESENNPLFDSSGNETADGVWHLCGCGDLIPLGVDRCENCRAIDDE